MAVPGCQNLSYGGSVRRHSTPRPMVGEARAHVQGESLKARAALHTRLLNSPITRGEGMSWEWAWVFIAVVGITAIIRAIDQAGSRIINTLHRLHELIALVGNELKERLPEDPQAVENTLRNLESQIEGAATDYRSARSATERIMNETFEEVSRLSRNSIS
jgi:hypothetical protein